MFWFHEAARYQFNWHVLYLTGQRSVSCACSSIFRRTPLDAHWNYIERMSCCKPHGSYQQASITSALPLLRFTKATRSTQLTVVTAGCKYSFLPHRNRIQGPRAKLWWKDVLRYEGIEWDMKSFCMFLLWRDMRRNEEIIWENLNRYAENWRDQWRER